MDEQASMGWLGVEAGSAAAPPGSIANNSGRVVPELSTTNAYLRHDGKNTTTRRTHGLSGCTLSLQCTPKNCPAAADVMTSECGERP